MTNPFQSITDPKALRAMVQDGVKCERCGGTGNASDPFQSDYETPVICLTCSGSGHTPLPNADLDALAACWCGSGATQSKASPGKWILDGRFYKPTTSPDAAVRLVEKYWLHIEPVIPEHPDEHTQPYWTIRWPRRMRHLHMSGGRHDSFCHAATKAALIAALTEAMEGAG